MSELEVRVVASDRMVWSGQAASLIARTVIGEIGILPQHEPVLALLDEGEVRITLTDDSLLRVAVHRGFLSVGADAVTILADSAELAIGHRRRPRRGSPGARLGIVRATRRLRQPCAGRKSASRSPPRADLLGQLLVAPGCHSTSP